MWSPRHAIVSVFLCILVATVLYGCRAFQPEAVIVNRAPETYIIGSPAETSGAYFHFHVYWYGTDTDGFVERYVWALTDTSIQDPNQEGDEEDRNFNPATNINTLAIGHYTTKTDSIFDFQINQGPTVSRDLTLHMVSIDDRGDFDRTPARLHFFSNALGQPSVTFYRNEVGPSTVFADSDTIGFGEPLILLWTGSTPNIAYYEPDLLALRDTVPRDLPPGQQPDGLLGFKWYLPGATNCDPSAQDCWSPRALNEATGDSFSYFGDVNRLVFLNDGSGSGPFGKRWGNDQIRVLVNTIDVAGVEIPSSRQLLTIVSDYDPDTYILRNEVDTDFGDTTHYPYYQVFYGENPGKFAFNPGDTVPNNSYVVLKAYGWDDRRDDILYADNRLSFQGNFNAVGYINGVSAYQFHSGASELNQTHEWLAASPRSRSADTLGFLVGPFDYAVIMKSVDELLRRDGTPDTLRFHANFPPCVQCIELANITTAPTFPFAGSCYDHGCLDGTTVLSANLVPDPSDPSQMSLMSPSADSLFYDLETRAVRYQRPQPFTDRWKVVIGYKYAFLVYLHGKDNPQEGWPPGHADERIGSWRYEVAYAADPGNGIRDGGGTDNIDVLSGFPISENNPDPTLSGLYIIPDTGVWAVRVIAGVPVTLLASGPESYWISILDRPDILAGRPAGTTHADTLAWQQTDAVQNAYALWQLSTMQFSPGTIQAIASDVSKCEWRNDTNMYHYYKHTRVPPIHGRSCATTYDDEDDALDLEQFPRYSNNGNPVDKSFEIEIHVADGTVFQGGGDPPHWIAEGKRARSFAWR